MPSEEQVLFLFIAVKSNFIAASKYPISQKGFLQSETSQLYLLIQFSLEDL